jgi:hypothetical protein
MYITVDNEVDGHNCITVEDGEKIYNLIHDLIIDKQSVTLDFTNIEIFAAPFFNAAIGRLFEDGTGIDTLTILSITDIGDALLHNVIWNSQKYYSDPIYRKAVDKIMEIYSIEGL